MTHPAMDPHGNPRIPENSTHEGRCLTFLINGAARNAVEIDTSRFAAFRDRVGKLALQIPDRLPEEDKIGRIRQVLSQFESYRHQAESDLSSRTSEWRAVVAMLLRELLGRMGIDSSSAAALGLINRIAMLSTTAELERYRNVVDQFLHPGEEKSYEERVSSLKVTDRSTGNNNAAGLRGGGSAVEHLARLMERGTRGFVAVFRLSCLEVISERFGMEVVEDCLMRISAYLTQSLRGEDGIYHWSDSSLLAVLQGRINEQALTMELRRIAANNRDIVVQVGERGIMLRVPLEFEIVPISRFNTADDLYKLSSEPVTNAG